MLSLGMHPILMPAPPPVLRRRGPQQSAALRGRPDPGDSTRCRPPQASVLSNSLPLTAYRRSPAVHLSVVTAQRLSRTCRASASTHQATVSLTLDVWRDGVPGCDRTLEGLASLLLALTTPTCSTQLALLSLPTPIC